MLVFKAKTVLSIQPVESKPYDFQGEDGRHVSGTSIKGTVTAMGTDNRVAVITVKGKTIEEAQRKLADLKLEVGKPAEIRIERATGGQIPQLQV